MSEREKAEFELYKNFYETVHRELMSREYPNAFKSLDFITARAFGVSKRLNWLTVDGNVNYILPIVNGNNAT